MRGASRAEWEERGLKLFSFVVFSLRIDFWIFRDKTLDAEESSKLAASKE